MRGENTGGENTGSANAREAATAATATSIDAAGSAMRQNTSPRGALSFERNPALASGRAGIRPTLPEARAIPPPVRIQPVRIQPVRKQPTRKHRSHRMSGAATIDVGLRTYHWVPVLPTRPPHAAAMREPAAPTPVRRNACRGSAAAANV